jgi:hypothetical protein
LRQELGQAGRRAAEKLYNRKDIARRLHQLLLSVTSRAQITRMLDTSTSGAQADRS